MQLSSRSGADAGDLQLGVRLAVAVLAAVTLAALDLEHDHLLVAALRHDLCVDFGASNEGLADRELLAAEHQHLAELQLVAGGTGQLLDPDVAAFAHAILLATCLD